MDDRTKARSVADAVLAQHTAKSARARRQAESDVPAPGVRIAIVTGPGSDVRGLLSTDIRLCKAALLYGDAVTLYSPNALMLGSVEQLATTDTEARIDFMRSVMPVLNPEQGPELVANLDAFARMRRKRRRTRQELLAVMRVEQGFAREWNRVAEVAGQLLEDAGAYELVPALRSGLLEVHPLVERDSGSNGEFDDAVIQGLMARTGEVLADTRAYPLFDDMMGDVVRAGLQEGLFRLPARTRTHARQIGTAAGLFEMLPTFPMAHVEEVLDARRELEITLAQFRGALIELTEVMAADALDEDFSEAVADLWVAKVEPAMAEIRELIRQHSYLRQLADRATANTGLAGAGLGLLVADNVHAPDLLAVGAGVAVAALRAAHDRWSARQAIRGQQFYFLHGVSERLD
jgi:hypothetical protein